MGAFIKKFFPSRPLPPPYCRDGSTIFKRFLSRFGFGRWSSRGLGLGFACCSALAALLKGMGLASDAWHGGFRIEWGYRSGACQAQTDPSSPIRPCAWLGVVAHCLVTVHRLAFVVGAGRRLVARLWRKLKAHRFVTRARLLLPSNTAR